MPQYHLTTQRQSSSVQRNASHIAKRRVQRAGTITVLLSTVVPHTGYAITADDLLSHRAVYELTLIDSERDSGIDFASGLFIFEVTGSSCAGWTLSSDMILSLEGQTGSTISTQTSYQAFEDGAGQVFTFQTLTETDGEEPVTVTGAAERASVGELAIRRFAEEETSTSATADTLFPNQLTEAVLTAALDGERLLFTSVFDGSHETGLAQPVTAVIGAPQEPTVFAPIGNPLDASAVSERGVDLLREIPQPDQAWPMTLSYFDPLEPDSGPSFVVSYTLDTNGVSDELVLDYGAFTLRGELADFQPFGATACP